MTFQFVDPQASHQHSRKTLEAFYEFDDFMESVGSVLDLGCGHGLDMLWWSTRTTRELGNPRPLNIRCTGVDRNESCATKHPLITYRSRDFESDMELPTKRFDVLWCHDAFQFVVDPLNTLLRWRSITNNNGMLVIIVPQTTNLMHNRQQFELASGCFYHWTLVSLIHILVISGWDCRGGFFRKTPDDPFIHAVVYKAPQEPPQPRASWYELMETGLLPLSADAGINRLGYLRQQDLVLPWLDKSLITYERY